MNNNLGAVIVTYLEIVNFFFLLIQHLGMWNIFTYQIHLLCVLQCCSASVPIHKVTKSIQWRRNFAITAISHQPPGGLHMLMPLQPVTLTFMTSLSTQPDIMLSCHRHDLWPQWLSPLMKPQRCLKLATLRRASAWPSLGLMWVCINHLASGINQSKAPVTAGSPPAP